MDKNQQKIEQLLLARQVIIPKKENDLLVGDKDWMGTFDIQYEGDTGYVALDVQTWGGTPVGTFVKGYAVTVGYAPGFFAFREGPLLLNMLADFEQHTGKKPALLLVDGHGTAHPRKLGVASWLGVKAGVPTIGIAKDPLVRFPLELDEQAGSRQPITLDGTIVGYALRTQTGIKPIYVSSGHQVSQGRACDIAFRFRGKYRIIEPIRRADWAARAFAKRQQTPPDERKSHLPKHITPLP
jgi:deoxyribonuclease V